MENSQLVKLKKIAKDNLDFIKSFTIQEWQQNLKDIMCIAFPLLKEDATQAIQRIKDFQISLSDNTINRMSCVSELVNGKTYEGVLKICEMVIHKNDADGIECTENIPVKCCIVVYEHENESSKELLNIPIECLRMNLTTKNIPITIHTLYDTFKGYMFRQSNAEIVGVNMKENTLVVIHDAFCKSVDGKWLVHQYVVKNLETIDWTTIKSLDDNDPNVVEKKEFWCAL